ncbi:MAG: FAD-binding and (Fe-S)-binding domain-containing protein [Propionicimonas sp.]|uniref:FAD-binding and (Fe-S)-binding domain-containing protein n=1 Tax=Propionicimonas sp. TaxID=1955623 RepID=UPI002B2092F8|nr:FAD-binding and (Fe-S)-binding domain-containing protein [Propionicimonas sp.]MEA4943369.1 FAD-binding and (Fe-S)-binding domain-containing protein [Propionicimonas sp.]
MTATSVSAETLATLLAGCVADSGQLRMAELDRRALAHDASHFLLHPAAVVTPRTAEEVAHLLRATSAAGIGLTFRSGGTSLSGQAGTDQVLADVRRHFTGVEILDDGARVRVEPGVTVRQLNAHLARYGRKFGPDPASEAACTIGGVVANNSSGMACGTVENSYRTLESVVAVLPSGTIIDTGAADADEKLRTLEPALYEGLLTLRRRVVGNPASVAKISQQFSMKNTMGYGINALVDHTTPVDILTHLLIGSEGTLAFVASATFRTVPVRGHVATALVVFDDLYAANNSLPGLVATGAATLELMDATSLRVGQRFGDSPAMIKQLDVSTQAALLLEYQATSAEELEHLVQEARPTLDDLPVGGPVQLTDDAALRAGLWTLRKGLYTSVAGARPSGSTALLEDVVVPVAKLADTCVELAGLFDRYSYADSVIFGHAKDGNVHFMITDRFENDSQLQRYVDFTEDMVGLILANDGSLKAEHGTGRVMAPFVRRQYGDELYEVMCEVKRLFDPRGLLNAQTIITDDPELHLKHIKLNPSVDEEVDRCTSCGYCEPVCPSRSLTLTPRQRIAVRREIESLEAAGELAAVARLEKEFDYQVVHTCAVDGMCGTACPVQINTGLLVKKLRRERTTPAATKAAWTTLARHWKGTTGTFSTVLTITAAMPGPLDPVLRGLNHAARAVLGTDNIPLWSAELPGGGQPRRGQPAGSQQPPASREVVSSSAAADLVETPRGQAVPTPPAAVYLPACVNVMFGPVEGHGVQRSFEALCAEAGITLLIPDGIESLCCGTPWSSKGVPTGYQEMKARVLPVIRSATEDGRLPVVCDASSCTEGFGHMIESDPSLNVEVIDAVTFVARHVLPVLGKAPSRGEDTSSLASGEPGQAPCSARPSSRIRKLDSVTLHPTCSSTQLGINPDLVTVAEAVAEQVNVPLDWGCCAFAGDRGMLHPELTAAATRPEAAEVARLDATAHASLNRTCELGMTRATGRPYRHILELLAEQLG